MNTQQTARAIIIFAHTPRTEAECKPLAVTQQAAEAVHGALLLHAVDTVRRVQHSLACDCILATDAPSQLAGRFIPEAANGHCVHLLSQRGESFGDTLQNTLHDAFQLGYKEVVVVGADAPDLAPSTLETAFERLAGNDVVGAVDVVLGPANDGGVYLMGFRCSAHCSPVSIDELLSGIAWQTSSVFGELCANAHASGHTLSTLPALDDIDSRADLNCWLTRAARKSYPVLLLSRHIRVLLGVDVSSALSYRFHPTKPAVQASSRLRLQFQKAPPVQRY